MQRVGASVGVVLPNIDKGARCSRSRHVLQCKAGHKSLITSTTTTTTTTCRKLSAMAAAHTG
eukprot:1129353-Pelagomonas_calceolata.AAC.2